MPLSDRHPVGRKFVYGQHPKSAVFVMAGDNAVIAAVVRKIREQLGLKVHLATGTARRARMSPTQPSRSQRFTSGPHGDVVSVIRGKGRVVVSRSTCDISIGGWVYIQPGLPYYFEDGQPSPEKLCVIHGVLARD